MVFELDEELADCECYNCERNLKNPNTQGTLFSRDDPIVAFRCYYCGRLFCNDCGEDHFGPNETGEDTDDDGYDGGEVVNDDE